MDQFPCPSFSDFSAEKTEKEVSRASKLTLSYLNLFVHMRETSRFVLIYYYKNRNKLHLICNKVTYTCLTIKLTI